MDDKQNITETNIIVTRLSLGALKPFSMLHITDLHLSYCDERDGDYENANAVERRQCFPNAAARYDDILKLLRDKKPDITALTGDIIDFPSESNFDELDRLTKACGEYVFAPGNHDWSYPRAYHTPGTLEKYMPRFKRYCGGDTDFSVREFNGVLLICIDDSRDCVTGEQLEMFRAQAERGMPMMLFMHVPLYAEPLIEKVMKVWRSPIVIGHSGSDDMTKRFRETVIGSNAVVVTGHVHFSREDVIGDCRQYITMHSAEGGARLFEIE